MYKVGSLVKLKCPCMNNSVGIIGYVYDTYTDFDNSSKLGISVIFPNGNYDGFSYKDQVLLLDPNFHQEIDLKYEFKNVMKLSHDFDRGVFNKVWQK